VTSCWHLAQPPSWTTAPCRLSMIAYSMYSQPPSISRSCLHPQPEDGPCCGDRDPLKQNVTVFRAAPSELSDKKYRDSTSSDRYYEQEETTTRGWMIWGSGPGRGWEFFSSPPRPDRLWGPPRLLSNGYQRLFPRGKGAGTRS
jgi:hypothetical protein